MCNRRTERRFPARAFDVYVNPLMIARGIGELIYPFLRDFQPVADHDFLSCPAGKLLDQRVLPGLRIGAFPVCPARGANGVTYALDHVKHMLVAKEKVPGFGHRVYKTLDPRAIHLKKLSEDLGKSTGHIELYTTSKLIEENIKEAKKLNANVDFYSASTYYSLGIPIDLFTPIFAVSRMSGWTAHILEQYHNNRLIRPRVDYTGLPDGQSWVDIASR